MSEQIVTKAHLVLDPAGTLTGRAWVFDTPDSVGDVITKGAVIEFPEDLPILVEHDQRAVIGTWKSVDITDAGLEVRGKLFVEGVGPARTAREQMIKGAMDGLSIGFTHNGFERLPDGGRRFDRLTITEISICKRPVHPGARISEVKSEPTPEPIETKDTNMAAAEKLEDNVPAEPTIEKKAFDALVARVGVMEARANRLPVGEPQNDNAELKSFEALLRNGEKRLAETEIKALTVANDGSAGYLAPTEYSSEILKKLVEFSPIRQYARVVTVGSREVKYPRKVSGATALWTDEGADAAASSMVYEQIGITPYQLTTFTTHPDFFVPGDDLRERGVRDGVNYERWRDDKLITAIDGPVIMPETVEAHIRELCGRFDVREIAFDPHLAALVMQRLVDDGYPAVGLRQGPLSMTPAIGALERTVNGRVLRHAGHPVLRHHFDSVVASRSDAGLIRMHKGKPTDRIDGAVAAAMAVFRATMNDGSRSISESEDFERVFDLAEGM